MANPVNSTQQNIPIAGIKDGVVLLKDGGYRVILSVTALNYALKSEQEQNALIFQYQSFLNSLHFPIEIVMQSKKLDLAPYIKKIKDISTKQQNELLLAQTNDYIDFVSQLVNMANIMKKSFYVIVPYQPLLSHNNNLLDKIFKKSDGPSLKISETEYNRYKDELMERAGVVASGLGSMGLHCVQLNTEQIIELMYKIYNPDVYSKERINDAYELANPVVSSEAEKAETSNQAPDDQQTEENLIDNSSLVRERQKEQFQQKQREEEKKAEKAPAQAPANPGQQPTATSQPQPSATTVPAQQPQVTEQNTQNFGN